jgi:hypothetical protein
MRGRVGPDFGPVPEREELDFPELDFAANKTGPGASRRNFQEIPGGSGDA